MEESLDKDDEGFIGEDVGGELSMAVLVPATTGSFVSMAGSEVAVCVSVSVCSRG